MQRLRIKSTRNATRIAEALAAGGFIVVTRFDGTFHHLAVVKF